MQKKTANLSILYYETEAKAVLERTEREKTSMSEI